MATTKKKSNFSPTDFIHDPARSANEFLAWAEQIRSGSALTWGIPEIDRVVLPMRPGTMTVLMARPGHAKSSLAAWLAKRKAEEFANDGSGRAVYYVTWEQTAEELENFFISGGRYSSSDIAWGRVSIEDLRQRAIQRARLPIFIVGYGISGNLNLPRMTPSLVLEAIESAAKDLEAHPKPGLLIFDYLQLIPVARPVERIQQVTEATIMIRELAQRLGCPAVACVQARREVDSRMPPIPDKADAQWSSSVEQTADTIFSLWRPAASHPELREVELEDGRRIPVVENLLILRLVKQRFERARYTWIMYFDPAYLRLADWEKATSLDYDIQEKEEEDEREYIAELDDIPF
jgi:replicative DNA helicase